MEQFAVLEENNLTFMIPRQVEAGKINQMLLFSIKRTYIYTETLIIFII